MRSCSMMLNIIARRTTTAICCARTSTSTTSTSTIAAAATNTTSLCSSSQRRYLVRRATSSLGCSTSSDSNSSLNSSLNSQSEDDANDDDKEEGKGVYYYDDDINDSEDLDLENDYVELQLAKQAKAATIKSVKFISSVVRHQDCPQTPKTQGKRKRLIITKSPPATGSGFSSIYPGTASPTRRNISRRSGRSSLESTC
jgi:hypothetical protein